MFYLPYNINKKEEGKRMCDFGLGAVESPTDLRDYRLTYRQS